MNLSQLLSISSHLASRCRSTAVGISSALQWGRDSWSHLHQTGRVTVLLYCVVRCCVSSLSIHRKAWPQWKLGDTCLGARKQEASRELSPYSLPQKWQKKMQNLTWPQMRLFMLIYTHAPFLIPQTRRKADPAAQQSTVWGHNDGTKQKNTAINNYCSNII